MAHVTVSNRLRRRLEDAKALGAILYPELNPQDQWKAAVRRRHRPRSAAADWHARLARKADRNRKEARLIPSAVRRDVLRRGYCTYCGGWASVVDHINPVAQGGTRRRRNLTPACSPCNSEKLDFTPEQWQQWREGQGLPWPPVPREVRIAARLLSVATASTRTGSP